MDLTKPRTRLERAKAHQRAFAEIWGAFLDKGDPYEVVVRVEHDGEGQILVYPNDLPDIDLSLEFGEMIYQLRAALDSLVYELAILDSGGHDPPPDAEQLEFPIRASDTAFKNVARKIAPLTDQHRAMIESIQPYEVSERTEGMRLTGKTLETLNDWARKDRHRGLRVIASWASNKNPAVSDLPDGCTLEWLTPTPDGRLEDDHVVARFKLAGWLPHMELEANPNMAIDVTIEDAAPPADDADTLSMRARAMIAVVAVIIEGFEKTLD